MAYRAVSFPMTLSDLERQDARNQFFRWISLITLVPFDIERQNSAGNMWEEMYFYGVTDAPTARGLGPSVPNFWGVPFKI